MKILSSKKPEKKLTSILAKHSGRDNAGHIAVRHQGGRHKRYYRLIDFKRDKQQSASVNAIEYDPNRRAYIALITYKDGTKAYIIAPEGLRAGDMVTSGTLDAEIKAGNTLKLSAIPIGTMIHNIEIVAGRGAKMVRAAGAAAVLLAKETGFAQVKLSSGEIRRFDENCLATVGQVSNIEWRHEKLGKAGRSRHMGIRPSVRGTAMNPVDHPHGGGEGRTTTGRRRGPATPWGKPARGVKTRNKRKKSSIFIVSRRKK